MGKIGINSELNDEKRVVSAHEVSPLSPIIMSDTCADTDKESVLNGKFDICLATFVCGRQKCGTILFNN